MPKILFLNLVLCLVLATPFAEARRPSTKIMQNLERDAQAVLAKTPLDNESCFSPNEPCAAKLIKFIETAKDTLEIAIFEMTDRKIAQAIVDADARKVKVRMVVNRKLVKDEGPAFNLIKATKIEVRVGKQKGIMHNKFTIVDRKRLETGSFNYTYAAGNSNHENQLYVSTPSVLTRYQDQFEQMWKSAKH